MSSGNVMPQEENKLVPKRFFGPEEAVNDKIGATILADMVRGSLFSEKPAMPPPEVFKWYVMFLVFEFIKSEHAWLFTDNSQEMEELLTNNAEELRIVLDLVSRQKMFGLQADVENALKTRRLYLPAGYEPPL